MITDSLIICYHFLCYSKKYIDARKDLKMDNKEILMINREYRNILNAIRCKPGIEKTVLAKQLNLAYKTLAKQLDDLEEINFIDTEPELQINKNKFLLCGLSIGGSQCKVIFIDAEYHILSAEIFDKICEDYGIFKQDFFASKKNSTAYGYKYFETPSNRTQLKVYINYIIKDIEKLYDISLSNKKIPPILSIGIALTGSVDIYKQVIVRSHNIEYMKNISREMLLEPDTIQDLKNRDIELVIDHNAKAMAVCEKFSLYHIDNENHEYAHKKNIACFYLGSGIGCGIILDNRLVRGCRNFSGELGHIQVPRYPGLQNININESCTCGAQNCLEHLIIHDVFEMNRNDFKRATSEEILKKIESFEQEGEEKYTQKMQILGYYIGWAIDSITKLLNVGLIIFSGKMTCFMTKAWSYLEPTVGDLDYAILDCQTVLSKYGMLAPSIGAAILSTYAPNEPVEWII